MEGDGGVSNRTWLSKRTCWSNRATGVPSWVRLLNHGSCCDGIRRSNAGGEAGRPPSGRPAGKTKAPPWKGMEAFQPLGSLLKHLARGPPAREDKKIPPAGPSRKKANLGERKASLPEKKAHLGERKASLPEKKAHLCERKASLPGKKAHLCGRKASLPGEKANLCGRKEEGFHGLVAYGLAVGCHQAGQEAGAGEEQRVHGANALPGPALAQLRK